MKISVRVIVLRTVAATRIGSSEPTNPRFPASAIARSRSAPAALKARAIKSCWTHPVTLSDVGALSSRTCRPVALPSTVPQG